MRRPLKITLAVIGIFLAIGIATSIFIGTRIDRLIVHAVETYGSATTGTTVNLNGADVSLRDTRGTLRGLTIGNPEGFDSEYAFQIDDLEVQLDLGSVGGDVIVIREVLVDGARLIAEQRGGSRSNLTEIQRYMETPDSEPGSTTNNGEPETRIIIDLFKLTNARVTILSELLDEEQSVDLREVVVESIGRNAGGASLDEVTEAVLTPILAAARAAVRDRLKETAKEALKEKLEEKARDKIKDLLNRD